MLPAVEQIQGKKWEESVTLQEQAEELVVWPAAVMILEIIEHLSAVTSSVRSPLSSVLMNQMMCLSRRYRLSSEGHFDPDLGHSEWS